MLSACYFASCDVNTSSYSEQLSKVPTTSSSFSSFNKSVLVNNFNQNLSNQSDTDKVSEVDVNVNLKLLQTRLSAVMNKQIPMEHVDRFVLLI